MLPQVNNLDNGDEFRGERQIRDVQDLSDPAQEAPLNSDKQAREGARVTILGGDKGGGV